MSFYGTQQKQSCGGLEVYVVFGLFFGGGGGEGKQKFVSEGKQKFVYLKWGCHFSFSI